MWRGILRQKCQRQKLKRKFIPCGKGKWGLIACSLLEGQITALLANGSAQKFIAKRYGTMEDKLRNWLKKRGLKPVKA